MNNQSIFALCIRICISTVLAITATFLYLDATLADSPQMPAGHPTRLSIPTLELEQEVRPVGIIPVVVEGNSYHTWNVLADRVGWHKYSAPVGAVGNTVLSGHSDVQGRVFQNLHRLEQGAEIIVAAEGKTHRYLVTQKLLLRERGVPLETRIKNAQWIAPSEDERLTLVTCAQPGATHRLIVVARPAERVHQAS